MNRSDLKVGMVVEYHQSKYNVHTAIVLAVEPWRAIRSSFYTDRDRFLPSTKGAGVAIAVRFGYKDGVSNWRPEVASSRMLKPVGTAAIIRQQAFDERRAADLVAQVIKDKRNVMAKQLGLDTYDVQLDGYVVNGAIRGKVTIPIHVLEHLLSTQASVD